MSKIIKIRWCLFQDDMNLTEDKKAPLRKKDYRMQKDMVAQWLNKTTTGTVHT